METDEEFDLRRNITLGMVKGDDEYDVYLINESRLRGAVLKLGWLLLNYGGGLNISRKQAQHI